MLQPKCLLANSIWNIVLPHLFSVAIGWPASDNFRLMSQVQQDCRQGMWGALLVIKLTIWKPCVLCTFTFYFCQFLSAQQSATLWLPSSEDSHKACTFIPVWTNIMLAPLCDSWLFALPSSVAFRNSCKQFDHPTWSDVNCCFLGIMTNLYFSAHRCQCSHSCSIQNLVWSVDISFLLQKCRCSNSIWNPLSLCLFDVGIRGAAPDNFRNYQSDKIANFRQRSVRYKEVKMCARFELLSPALLKKNFLHSNFYHFSKWVQHYEGPYLNNMGIHVLPFLKTASFSPRLQL